MKTYAHYVSSRSGNVVIISYTERPVGKEIAVSGRREARKIAAEFGAEPWNF